jgi:hypothetical protein
MYMHKVIVLLFLAALASCKEISFREPQPKGKRALKEIPRELRGEYLLVDDDNNTDTLIVTAKGYLMRSDSTEGSLGDSLVLKKYKGYYFFNDHEDPEWLLRVVKQESNGDLSYLFMDSGEKTFNEYLLELTKEIKIDSSEVDGQKLYQIDPSPRQLLSLIRKGFFRKSLMLKKLK